MIELRTSKRIPFRNNVRYGLTDPPQFLSFITDFSDTGIYIKTNKIFTPGTKLFLVIETGEGDFKAKGVVAWAKKAPPHLVRHMKSGMGIKFTEVDQRLVEIYKQRL
ncbi:MAG: PilZ domain-containing protein [Thermodesulfobacteriota bacterium]